MKLIMRIALLNSLAIALVMAVTIFFTVPEITGHTVGRALLIAALFIVASLLLLNRTMLPLIKDWQRISEALNRRAIAIAEALQQQAGQASRLSSSVVEISSTMEEFSSTAGQIAQHSHKVVERADQTLDDTKRGASEVENLTFKINDINSNIEANLNEIISLGKKSKEINKIMEIINHIANQTKLIAFNAALEAASAGEAGKRFGVVAVEIRRLADSVVESTGEIEARITEIQDAVNRLVMSSEKSSQLTQEGQEYASHTVVMLIESVDGVEETADAARQISTSIQQQQVASSQVVSALKDISEGTRITDQAFQEANGAIAELTELVAQLRRCDPVGETNQAAAPTPSSASRPAPVAEPPATKVEREQG